MSINLPPGWEASVDPTSGRTFYVNHNTQQTSWTPPIDSPLPPGWEELRDEHGRTFFYNAEMNKTTWQDPRLSGASSVQSSHAMAIDPSPMPSAYPSLSASSPAAYNRSNSSNSEPKYRLKIDGGSSSSRTWTCSQCTFENPNSSSSCEMCGYAMSGDNPPVKPPKPGSLSVDSDAAMAAALQEELNREAAREESFADREVSEEKIKGYQATEPFELLPNMVPDETSTKCLRCSKEFGKLTNRKHHCRCCGMLVCAECSTKKTVVRLPTQEENLNEKERRVCDWCYDHLVDGHAHCLYRYVVVASKEQDENRELAIKGIAEIMEQLPQQMSSSSDRAQATRDLEILKFVGGVAKMCSFLSPGDRPSTQAQACRLVAALASASCIRELEDHLPKRQVASEMSEGAALAIMSTILERSPNSKENLNAQISAARVLYLLGDVPTLKSAAREAGLIGPLCDALLSSDGQLQDWSCMCLGRLLKGDRNSVEEVLKHNGIHNLVLLLSSTNTLIQEHAAVTLQEALIVDPVSQAPKVKKALAGFSGTPAALRLLQSGEGQVVSAGLRLLLILSETEAQQIRVLDGIPSLVSIIVGNGNAAETLGAELQTLALQVLRNVANVGALERHAITQCGGLSASVTLMKSSTNSFVRKEATILVEALSSDADGARGVMEASGGIAGLVDVVKTSSETTSSFSASNALSQILLQGPEAQAAMLEAGALEALLAAGSRGDLPTACRVVEATFSFVSDPELLPKLASNVPPPTLAQRLIHLGTSMRNSMPGHVTEQLVLTLAVLCGAKADDYKMSPPNPAIEDETPPVLKVTAPQTRALVAANGSAWLVSLVQNSLRSEPGVALACLRCLLAVSNETMNGDKVVQGGGLPVVLTAIADNLRAGDAPDTSSPQTQILLHAIALFARLCGGSRPRDAGRDMDSVKRGLRLLNDALDCHEPECMLTSVRALSECSFQSGTWSTIAETALPRCVEMLLADKTGHGPGGRDPLSSSDVLRLLMDVSTITSNLAKLEVHANAILDSGGALALISLLSEPEDDATSSGVNALWALSESSRKCASMISRAETGAIVQLLHLSETHRNKAQATRALKLVKRLAETDGQNAAQIGSTTAAVDSLLRLVRFEQSEDALGALCAVASASDALWERLADTSDVSSTVLILERGGPNSARIQGRACRAIAVMCDQNPAMCVAEDVLRGALPTVVKLLSPADSLGADKSESPAVDAAWAIAMICHSGLRDNVAETLGTALTEYNALQGCIQMLLRERRLGRPRSQSTAQALRAVRALLTLAGHKDGLQFWQQVVSGGVTAKVGNRKDDVFSALVMALDANVGQCTSMNAKDAMQAVDDVCFLLATFPEGLAAESYLRLSRPLTQAFEKSLQLGAFRISCLKAMTRAVKETSLASAMVGSARAVASSLASTSQEKDSASAQIETGLLLAALLKNTPNDRIVQDAVASSGALGVLFKLLARLHSDRNTAFTTMEESTEEDFVLGACRALALLCESGGNAVKRALRQSGSEISNDGNKGLILMLRDLIRDEHDSSWDEDSKRDYCFRILTRIASLDEHREEFFAVKSCCFTALVKRKCLRPAIELLGWLGTVEGEEGQTQSNGFAEKNGQHVDNDEGEEQPIDNDQDTKQEEEQAEEVDRALLEIAFDKTMPVSVRLQALQSCEFFIAPAKQQTQQQRSSSLSNKSLKKQIQDDTMIAFPKEIFYPTESKKLFYPALLVLERLIRARRVDIQPLLPSLISVMKLDQNLEDNQGLFELVCSCLFESCRKSPKVRQLLKSTEGFLKVFKGMNLYNQLSAQKLLKVLGEEFIAEKPAVGPSPMIKRTDSGSVSVVSSIGEKRSQDEMRKTSTTNGVLSPVAPPPGGPPPPPPLKSAFPTFTATPSAQERSSLDLAMRLQQLEMSNAPVTATSSYPRAPSSMPPPSFSSSSGSQYSSSNIWNCPACTLENEKNASECAACGQARPGMSGGGVSGGGGAVRMQIQCSGCGTKLQAPSTAPSVSCPNCRAVTSLQGSSTVRVRCKSCIKELYAPSNANQFKCSNCGTVGSVRDSKV